MKENRDLSSIRWTAVKNRGNVDIPPFGVFQVADVGKILDTDDDLPQALTVDLPHRELFNAAIGFAGPAGIPAGKAGEGTFDLPALAHFDVAQETEYINNELVFVKHQSAKVDNQSADAIGWFKTAGAPFDVDGIKVALLTQSHAGSWFAMVPCDLVLPAAKGLGRPGHEECCLFQLVDDGDNDRVLAVAENFSAVRLQGAGLQPV